MGIQILVGRGIFMNKKIYHVYLLDIDSHCEWTIADCYKS